MSSATFYKWRSQYGGMDLPMITRLKELEHENSRLKKMYKGDGIDKLFSKVIESYETAIGGFKYVPVDVFLHAIRALPPEKTAEFVVRVIENFELDPSALEGLTGILIEEAGSHPVDDHNAVPHVGAGAMEDVD